MVAVVFPGQGSQKPGMGLELVERSDASRRVFETASEATGLDVSALCFHGDEDTLRRTENAQIALFTVGVAAWRALEQGCPWILPGAFAGHSVGEYAALVSAGIVSLGDGARMVRRRGEIMAEAGGGRAGGMAAILGLGRAELEEVCLRASAGSEVVVIANDNSPGQLVISGDKAAVEKASALATEAGAKRTLALNVSGAFHSPLMGDAAADFGAYLRGFSFSPATAGCAVFTNVSSEMAGHDTDWPAVMESQLISPVRWTESVQNMAAFGCETFIECGVGEVLCGLIRRIEPSLRTMAVNGAATLQSATDAFAEVPSA